MSNRLFQGIIHQMRDAVDRVIGVIDDNGVIIACSELVKIVSASQPGDEMTLTVYRQGESEQLTLTLTVGEQQKSALADPTSSSNQQQSSGSYGGFPFGFGYGYGG